MLSIGEWDVVECFMFEVAFLTLTSDGFSFDYLIERKFKAYITIVRRSLRSLSSTSMKEYVYNLIYSNALKH